MEKTFIVFPPRFPLLTGNMVEGGVGASHAPVPEPATMLLLGLGLAGVRKKMHK
jgi:hypothetical protein